MNDRKRSIIIRTAAVLLFALAAFAVVFYARGDFDLTFIDRSDEPALTDTTPEDTVPPEDTDLTPETDRVPDATDTSVKPPETDPEADLPDYDGAAAKIPSDADVKSEGKRLLYGGLYDPETCTVARIESRTEFPAEYSLRNAPARTVSSDTGGKGETYYSESYEDAPRPVLTPYFGYLIFDDGRRLKLLDSTGRVLMQDISAYTPTGYRDLSGHPLFKRDGLYYYYYDGSSTTPDTVVLDRITAEDVWEFPRDSVPASFGDVDVTAEVTPSLPDSAGMVECTVDENYFNTVSLLSSYESRHGSSEIFRFCQHRIVREMLNQPAIDARLAEIEAWNAGVADGSVDPAVTPQPQPVEPQYKEEDQGFFWGYMNAEGDWVITPQYEFAYDFSDNGLAAVSDPDSPGKRRVIVINASGNTVINAYRTVFTDVEQGTLRVRDGHYLPDLFGSENAGMLTFDHSLMRVRRRVVTVSGARVQSESSELVDARGKLFALPDGYELIAYSDGVALLEKDGLYGYMDYTGSWIVQPDLTRASAFSEGLAAAGYEGHVGLIDRKGSVVVPMIYDSISDCSDGVFCAYSEGHGWTLLGKFSRSEYTEPSNPILRIKKQILAIRAYDETYGEQYGSYLQQPAPAVTVQP